ncbi:hypothetical protein [Streptomyces chartreusis]|uniref:Uncharacterized protein n=1 Tax=Streptomyces chartreusis TaxID=1969 RepID=A0A7H8T9X8_STRCX|nr:hypothetical protein [Streptomyces chartreusis]QKZ20285.1 hypothetical protein HUT05_24790 [Streptomyces chartreusis]
MARSAPRKTPAKKTAAPGQTSVVTVKGPLKLNGSLLRCPGRSTGSVPRRLTLMISGSEVHVTCGERHPPEGRRPSRRDPQCFFVLPLVTPAVVRTIAARAEPGRPFAFQLPGGQVLEGKRDRAARAARAAGAGPAASAHASRAASARAARAGKPTPARGGGALVAGLNTVTAVAQAVGQTAGAAGAAVSSTAGAVGKIAELGREGMRTGRAAIEAADNAGARRFARDNRRTGDEDGDASAG